MDPETFSLDAGALGRHVLMGTSPQLSYAQLTDAGMLGVLGVHQFHVAWASLQLCVLSASASLSWQGK